MSRLQNRLPEQQEPVIPAFFQPTQQPVQQPVQEAAPVMAGPMNTAFEILQEFEDSEQQPIQQPLRLPDPSQVGKDPFEVLKFFDADELAARDQDLYRKEDELAAQKEWWGSLSKDEQKKLITDQRVLEDQVEIDRLVAEREQNPLYKDAFGHTRQHDALGRAFRKLPGLPVYKANVSPSMFAIAGDYYDLKSSSKRFANGEADKKDLELLAGFKSEMKYYENRKMPAAIADAISELPAVAIDFFTTRGAYTGAKAGVKTAIKGGLKESGGRVYDTALKQSLKQIGKGKGPLTRSITKGTSQKTARAIAREAKLSHIDKEFAKSSMGKRFLGEAIGTTAGVAAQTAAMPNRIHAAIAYESYKRSVEGKPDSLIADIGGGVTRQLFEVGSERAAAWLGLPAKTPWGKAATVKYKRLMAKLPGGMRQALISRAAKSGISQDKISKMIKAGGLDSVAGELFEERVNEAGLALVGLDKYEIPDLEQLIIEAVTFSVPAGASAYGRMKNVHEIGKQRAKRKEYLEKLRPAIGEDKENARKEFMLNLDAHAKEMAKDKWLVANLRDLTKEKGKPSRSEWKKLGLPEYRLDAKDRAKVAGAVLSQHEIDNTALDLDVPIAKKPGMPVARRYRPTAEAPSLPVAERVTAERPSSPVAERYRAQKPPIPVAKRYRVGDEEFTGPELPQSPTTEPPDVGPQLPQSPTAEPAIEDSPPPQAKAKKKKPFKRKGLGRKAEALIASDIGGKAKAPEVKRDREILRGAVKKAFANIQEVKEPIANGIDAAKGRVFGPNKKSWGLKQKWLRDRLNEGKDIAWFTDNKSWPDENAILSAANTEGANQFSDIDKLLGQMSQPTKRVQVEDPEVFDAAWKSLQGWGPGAPMETKAKDAEVLDDSFDFGGNVYEESAPLKSKKKKKRPFRKKGKKKKSLLEAQAPPWPDTGIPKEMGSDARSEADKKQGSVAGQAFVATAEKLFGIKVKTGHMGRVRAGVRGYYDTDRELIRMRERLSGGLSIPSHEVAHHIDKTHGLRAALTKVLRSDSARFDRITTELEGMDYKQDRKEGPMWQEGFAEWIRHYTTGSEDHNQAPEFTKFFEGEFANQSDLLSKINRLRDVGTKWRDQGSKERVRAAIVTGDKNKQSEPHLTNREKTEEFILTKAEKVYSAMVDEAFPIGKAAAEAAAKGYEGLGAYQLLMGTSHTAMAHAERAIIDVVYSVGPGKQKKLSDGLLKYQDYLKKGEYQDFRDYIASKHAIEVWDTGVMGKEFNPGISLEDAKQVVAEVEANPDKLLRFDKGQKVVTDFGHALFEMMVEIPGAKTHTDFIRASGKWNFWVPLHRISTEQSPFLQRLGRSGMLNLKNPVFNRRVGGSGKQIQDPIISLAQMAHSYYSYTLTQSVKWEMVKSMTPKLGGVSEMGHVVEYDVAPNLARERFQVEEALKQLIDGGFVPKEHGDILRAAYNFRKGKARFSTIKKLAIQLQIEWPSHLKGTSAARWDAVKSKHFKKLTKAEQKAVIKEIGDRIDEIPDIIEQISIFKPKFIASHGDHIEVMHVDGKPVLVQWDPVVYQAFNTMDNMQGGLLTSMFRLFQSLKKLGAIGVNFGFGATNPIRDWQALQHQSKFSKGGSKGWFNSAKNPLLWIVRSAAHMVKKGDAKYAPILDLWHESGGFRATQAGADVNSIRRLQRRMENSTMKERVTHRLMPWNWKESMTDAVDSVRATIGIAEVGPRAYEFTQRMESLGYEVRYDSTSEQMRFYNKAEGKFERPDRDSIIRSINASNDVTTNFKRAGSYGKHMNIAYTFSNATIQGQDKQVRTIMEAFGKHKAGTNPLTDKQRSVLKGRLTVALLTSAAFEVAYWMAVSDEDAYKAQADWLTDGYWTFFWKGDPIARVPRDHSWNTIGLVTRSILDTALGGKDGRKDSIRKAFKHMITNRNPLGSPVFEGPLKFVTGAEMPLVKPTFEVTANWDMFKQMPIEGKAVAGNKPEDRYNPHTGWAAKSLGKAIKTSPAKLDHWINSATGGLSTDIQKLTSGNLLGMRSPLKSLGVSRDYTDDVQEFYQKHSSIKEELSSAKHTGKGDVEKWSRLKNQFDHYTEIMRDIREPFRDEKNRKKKFHGSEKWIIGLSRFALGMPPLARYPNPLADGGKKPPNVQAVVDKYIGNWVWTATAPSDGVARQYARERLKAIGMTPSRSRGLIRSHGKKEYRERMKKKKPFQRVQRPASSDVRRKRTEKLKFLRAK